MKEFEYLVAEIDPPDWLIMILGTLVIGTSVLGIWINNGKRFFTRHQPMTPTQGK